MEIAPTSTQPKSVSTAGDRRLHGSSILDVVEEAAKKILIAETLLFKRLGIDDVPIPISDRPAEYSNELSDDQKKLAFLLQYDQGQSVTDLVKEFATAATTAAIALHQEIECVPQNRPFGGTISVERLMVENLNLMNEILEYDDKTSDEYWTEFRVKEIQESIKK